ncbi:T9SS type A sorting domain-containing protein [Aureispira anguillae]|uniref:T9SS type A sorting domain-containing protein n=1 Tax=Aureispira anguillae TaxID=2864201 RepID=A0A915YK41_9BACT|nr:T9SS type A sorting domain-containing protein [Aureispira anguillae]BDS14698.1 T9SS type A sorting domain-containing protein [Aureispira anguillae]
MIQTDLKLTVLVVILLLFNAINIQAQLNTSGYRVDQSNNDVEICQGSANGTYTVTAKTSSLNNFQITLTMPPGISYVAGSASITSGGATYTISEVNISDLRAPVLAISNNGLPANLWGVGDQVVFTIARVASCPAVAHALAGRAFKDSITINYENNSIAENGVDNDTTYGIYNADFVSLSILTINNVNTTLTTPESRNITIRQGGNSCIQQFQHFVVVGRDINNYQLRFGATNLTPTSTVANGSNTADTLFYTIDLNAAPFSGAVGNGNNCFENGEDLILTESFSANTCINLSMKHHARWSCNGNQICQEAVPQNGSISFVNGAPTLTISEVGGTTAPELCDTINHTLQITNTATATSPLGGAIAYDVAVVFGLGHNGSAIATPASNSLWGSNRQDTRYWNNFIIGSTPVNDSALAYANNAGNNSTYGTASFLIQNLLTTNPDGPGGLEDLDGDGFFDDLAPGETFSVSFDYWASPRTNCGDSHYYSYMGWEHKYFDVSFKDQCLLDRPAIRRDLGYRNIIRDYLINTLTSSPTDVFDGQNFTVGIRPHFYNNGYLCRGESMTTGSNVKWSISLELPAGIDTATSAISNLDTELAPYNPTITKVGNIVTYTLDRYIYDTLHFPLTFDCATFTGSAITSIPYTTNYFCGSPGDTCFYRQIHCGELSNILTHCNTNCNGPIIYSFDASRTTPGYTDNTQTALVTLNPTVHKTKFYYPFDTMLIEAKAYMSDTAVGNLLFNINLTIPNGGTDLLTFVGGELLINDVSSGSGYQSFVLDGMPANLTHLGGQNYTYTMDLSRYVDSVNSTYLYGGVDGSNAYSADTICLQAKFTFGSNFAHQTLFQIDPFRANFSTLATGNVTIACDSLGDKAQYEKVGFGWGPSRAYPFSNCSPGNVYLYFTHRASTGDDHPGEYRPPSHWDSTKMVIPNYAYTGNRFSFYNAAGFTVLPHTISGDTVTIYRPTTGYNDRDKISTYYPSFQAEIMGNCETPPVQTMRAWNYYKEFAYHPDSTIHQSRSSVATARLEFTPPSWSFQALTPVVDGVQDTVFWDIELCNTTSGADIDYNWLFIPPQANIDVESIFNITSGTEVAIPYVVSNDSIFIELGAMNSNACRRLRFYATYNSCSNQVLTVNHGWDCSAYPTNYSAITSACYRSLNLLLEPRASEVQVTILRQPTTPQLLCTDTTYVVEISSAQLADLRDPVLEIRGTTGVSFSSIRVEYPRNSGNIEVLTPTIATNLANVNLSGHSQIAAINDGIKGTANAQTNDERFVTVSLDLQFTCGFSSNSSMSFAVHGNQPCGNPATGSGVRTKTNQIEIDGAVAPYNAYTGTTVTPSPIRVQHCSGLTTIRVQTTIIGDTTTANDTTEVFLPLGTTYAPGSYTCASSSCPTGVSLDTTNGRPRLVFPYPSGITSGTTLDYSFAISGSAGFCSNNEELEVNSYVIAGNINCLGTPCGPVKIITGEANELAIIEKPDLVISNLNGRSFNSGTNQAYAVSQQITNNGLDAPSGILIDYYCIDGTGNPIGSPIGSHTVPVPIASGQTLQDTGTFVAGSPLPCGSNTNSLAAVISPSNSQCICLRTQTSFSSILLGINITSFEAKLIDERKGLLTWTTETPSEHTIFEIERAISYKNNSLTYEKIATVHGSPLKKYSHTEPYLTGGTHYFRIKTIDIDGSISYSQIKALTVKPNDYIISLYPNPSKGTVWVDFGGILIEDLNIKVFNSIGQKVHAQTAKHSTLVELNLEHLPSGNYVIKLNSTTTNKNLKFTITKP